MFPSLKSFFQRFRPREPFHYGQVRLDTDGVSIERPTSDRVFLAWSDIQEVFAFNEDLFSYDEIVVGFNPVGADYYHPVYEGDDGFKDLFKSISNYLPGADDDWYSKICFQGFNPTLVVIYRRN